MGIIMRAMAAVCALLLVGQAVEATTMRFTLKPTTQLGSSASNFPTFNDIMYMKLVDPAVATTCVPDNRYGDNQTNCGGNITVDLTGVTTLEFSFEAQTGYQIELSLTDRSRFELQLSNMNSAMSGTMNTCAANTYLDASGQGSGNTGWIPTLTGASTSGMTYNAGSSFVAAGRPASDPTAIGYDSGFCEINTRLQFDGPVTGTFTQVLWSVPVSTAFTAGQPMSMRFGTDLYCWIRTPSKKGQAGDKAGTIRIRPVSPSPVPAASVSPSPVTTTGPAHVASGMLVCALAALFARMM